VTRQQLELNQINRDVVAQFRKTAQSKYEANQVTQQDVLQAEVEVAQLERKSIELARADRLAVARINTLLRQEPFSELPPPPKQLPLPVADFDVEALQELAVNQRPDLAALSARVRAQQAAVTLACKNYFPDAEVFGRYDAFWQEPPLQTAVGVNLNVPIYRGRLNAAVREERFELSQLQAEYEQLLLDAQYEVTSAYEQVAESHRTVQLYEERLIPAVKQNVAAAQANYDVNKVSFLDLAVAERQLIELEEAREEAIATYHSRLAELRRTVGGVLPNESEADDILAPISE
jgi:outer membrane protein TolC